MYNLSEEQVMFIESDLRARGVEMDSLRENLLDHICCILEDELEANGDFRQFYERVLPRFYKSEIREIESETKLLLQNKNYYIMKKSMIISGVLASSLLSVGLFLKFMHSAGAGMLIFLGIVLFSFLFLPLMFMLRMGEKENTRDKVMLGIGLLVTALISMGTLFKIMHWPGANFMGLSAVGMLLLIYLPLNLVTGLKNPATKTNTIVSSILLVAGCGIFLSLVRSPEASRHQYIQNTYYFLRNEQLLQADLNAASTSPDRQATQTEVLRLGKEIVEIAETLKAYLIRKETGNDRIEANFIQTDNWLGETFTTVYFDHSSPVFANYKKLVKMIDQYNALCDQKGLLTIDGFGMLTPGKNERIYESLNNLVQLQLIVLRNERVVNHPKEKLALLR